MNFTIYIVVVVGGNNGSLVEMIFFGDVAKRLEWGTDACGGVIFSPSSWEPQEEGMMSIAARFSLSKETKVCRSGEE
jgi:hypothetical protein